MFLIDNLILLASVLTLFAIAFSRFASRLGMPVLVLFIGVGMLAGSEGVGGIEFENYALAHAVGTVGLAIILFDGGLGTSYSAFRLVWRPAALLATVGVLVTTLATGLLAAWLLGLPVLEGLLLGAIVGSTDAAAVFAVLRGQGMNLDERLTRTLEVESGSNDPMAIFLTIGLIEVLLGQSDLGVGLLGLFFMQMGVGTAVGLAVGKGATLLINRISLDSAGLYPVLTAATGLFAFGLAAALGGSGFLAIYLAGIVVGNSPTLVFRRGIFLFHDGMAWLGQIAMFVVLGLLSFPSRLMDAAPEGLLVAAGLILLARPLAVFGLTAPFGFSARELVFISWAGLKGAVPVLLATFPLLLGLPGGHRLFDIIFFVVLVSAILQGSTLGWLARKLRLLGPKRVAPPISLEISSLKHVEGDIIDYGVDPNTRLVGRAVRDLNLPDGALVALVTRGQRLIPPRGSTRLQADDHLFVVVRPELRPLVDRLFSGRGTPGVPEHGVELQGGAILSDLAELYGLDLCPELPPSCEDTLDGWLRHALSDAPLDVGTRLQTPRYTLEVTELRDGRVKRLRLLPRPPDPPSEPEVTLDEAPPEPPATGSAHP